MIIGKLPEGKLRAHAYGLAAVTLSRRLRANAALLQLILHQPGGVVGKRALHSLAADLALAASQAEELEALAGQVGGLGA